MQPLPHILAATGTRLVTGASLALVLLAPRSAALHGGIVPPPPDLAPPQSGGPTVSDAAGKLGDRDRNELTQWTWWWEFNRHSMLDLRARLEKRSVRSGSDDFFLGYGVRPPGEADGDGPTPAEVRDTVVPALLRTLERARSNDLIRRTIVALAKIGEAADTPPEESLIAVFGEFLDHPVSEVAEAAVISLGVLGNESAAGELVELMSTSTRTGRALRGKELGPYRNRHTLSPHRLRAFAAYGLALLASRSEREDVRRYAIHHLAQTLEEGDTPTADLEVACILGLGIIPLENIRELPRKPGAPEGPPPPPSSSREAQIDYLLRHVAGGKNDYRVRAHGVTSVGRLMAGLSEREHPELRERVAKALLRLSHRHSREPREILQSSVLALGEIADSDADPLDAELRARLMEVASDSADQQSRNFALISMGRTAARTGLGNLPASGRGALRAYLVEGLEGGKSLQRPWAGLGLGLMGRGMVRSGEAVLPETLEPLRTALARSRSPAVLGAWSVAAALAFDSAAGDAVLAGLEKNAEDRTRGYLVLAIGMMDAREGLEPLLELLEKAAPRPELFEQTALALGMLGRGELAPRLAGLLEEAGSSTRRASIAFALGLVGDRSSVPHLVSMLLDEELTELARSIAAAALGFAADKDPVPFGTRISSGLNYRAVVETLFDDRYRGVLNLL